jgi:hypothetical protein
LLLCRRSSSSSALASESRSPGTAGTGATGSRRRDGPRPCGSGPSSRPCGRNGRAAGSPAAAPSDSCWGRWRRRRPPRNTGRGCWRRGPRWRPRWRRPRSGTRGGAAGRDRLPGGRAGGGATPARSCARRRPCATCGGTSPRWSCGRGSWDQPLRKRRREGQVSVANLAKNLISVCYKRSFS